MTTLRHDLDRLHCEETRGGVTIKAEFRDYGCPYCGPAPHRPYGNTRLTKGIPTVRCDRCELVYPRPRLSAAALRERVDGPVLNTYLQAIDLGSGASPDHRREIAWILRHAGAREGRALRAIDVGCGGGEFVAQLAAHGLTAAGVEANTVVREFGRRRGLTILADLFEADVAERGPFDLIAFRESLCMFFDVKAALARARELLAPRGWLYVKNFDVDSVAIRWLPRASGGIRGLEVPGGLSRRSLAWILRDAGFEPMAMLQFNDDIPALTGLRVPGASRVVSAPLRLLKATRNFAIVARPR